MTAGSCLRSGLAILVAGVAGLVLSARAAARPEAVVAAVASFAARYSSALHEGTSESLFVNGLRFEIHSGTSREPAPVVLDEFEDRCRRASALPDELRGLRRHVLAGVRTVASAIGFDGALRVDEDGRGVVGCLAPERPMGALGLEARLRELAPGLDLERLGTLEIATAFEQDGSTTYVVVTALGPLSLSRAFPPEGDAPGHDVPGAPRPRHGVRVLSAWTPESATGLAVYAVPGPDAGSVIDGYRTALVAMGWRVEGGVTPHAVAARHEERTIVASVTGEVESGVFVTVAAL